MVTGSSPSFNPSFSVLTRVLDIGCAIHSCVVVATQCMHGQASLSASCASVLPAFRRRQRQLLCGGAKNTTSVAGATTFWSASVVVTSRFTSHATYPATKQETAEASKFGKTSAGNIGSSHTRGWMVASEGFEDAERRIEGQIGGQRLVSPDQAITVRYAFFGARYLFGFHIG